MQSAFKGTIAVVVIYIIAAAGILATMLIVPTGIGAFFANDAVAFTIVLVTGMVLLSAYLAYQVINYDASLQFVPVSPIACPDYYTLNIDNTLNSSDPDRVIRCDADVNVYKLPKKYPRIGATGIDTAVISALGDDTGSSNIGGTSTLHTNVTCATLYPTILVKNETDSYSLRKSFAQACAVPWTDNAGNFAVLDAKAMQL